jgi:hypothetical protein
MGSFAIGLFVSSSLIEMVSQGVSALRYGGRHRASSQTAACEAVARGKTATRRA